MAALQEDEVFSNDKDQRKNLQNIKEFRKFRYEKIHLGNAFNKILVTRQFAKNCILDFS